MKPLARLAFACLTTACLLPAAARADDFLDVDAAFRLQPQAADGRVALAFDIAPGYYLYRDRFTLRPQGDSPGPTDIRYPKGEIKHDPTFDQKMEVYHQAVRVEAGFDAKTPAGETVLKLTYQGCAEAGLCYPPKTRLLRVSLGDGGKVTAVADADAGTAPALSTLQSAATAASTAAASAPPAVAAPSAPAAAGGWESWPLWQKAVAALAALAVVVFAVRALSGGGKPSA